MSVRHTLASPDAMTGESVSRHRRVSVYLDPPSHHFLNDRLFEIDGTGIGEKLLAPYVYLREFLNARGIEVHTADFLPAATTQALNLYVSFGRLPNYRKLAARKDLVLSAFFALECPTVEPATYRALNDAQNFFKRVFSWSDSPSLTPFVGGELRCLQMCWPQSFNSVHEEIWNRKDRGFLVMINGNKFPRFRSHCRELYSERMRAIAYFGQTKEIDLYGVGWAGPTFIVGTPFIPGTFQKLKVPGLIDRVGYRAIKQWQRIFPNKQLEIARTVYKGPTPSKSKTLGEYKFAVCFENSVLKGWITEKLFDCFFAGTIPVYLGAPDIEDYVPGDCFIDMRRFGDYAALKAYLKSLTEAEISSYRENARRFLSSPAYRPFTIEAFAQRFVGIIEEDAGVTLPREPVPASAGDAC